jgi:transposase-like protein
MILDHQGNDPSLWSAAVSIAEKIGCVPQMLHEWVKKAEVNSRKRGGIPTYMGDKLKALKRENREQRDYREGAGTEAGLLGQRHRLEWIRTAR